MEWSHEYCNAPPRRRQANYLAVRREDVSWNQRLFPKRLSKRYCHFDSHNASAAGIRTVMRAFLTLRASPP
jgi:hypothetical protein